jgi:ubiquinone/menaquinone biosynthesis C-methylase UbiE
MGGRNVSMQQRAWSGEHASSTGQTHSGSEWLDAHFEMARPEYVTQLHAVGIQPGWHVLDAACGSGPFLPWMAELVGPNGRLAALDLADDNVALVEQRVQAWDLACLVEACVGTVLDLPYPDDHFDAVWFANTSQYLSDDELMTALAEFRRVVRPGGLVAVKEIDAGLIRFLPAPPNLYARLYDAAAAAGAVQERGVQRAPALPAFLRRAGFVGVWGRGTLIERSAPLEPVAHRFFGDVLAYFAQFVRELALPDADQAFWAGLRIPEAIEQLLNDPDFWFCDGNVLTVGTVPGA